MPIPAPPGPVPGAAASGRAAPPDPQHPLPCLCVRVCVCVSVSVSVPGCDTARCHQEPREGGRDRPENREHPWPWILRRRQRDQAAASMLEPQRGPGHPQRAPGHPQRGPGHPQGQSALGNPHSRRGLQHLLPRDHPREPGVSWHWRSWWDPGLPGGRRWGVTAPALPALPWGTRLCKNSHRPL